jgi:hypothetical protein
MSARFLRLPDAVGSDATSARYLGPTMLLAIRAERGARSVAFDLTFEFSPIVPPGTLEQSVVANALASLPLPIAVESLFTNELSRDLRFDDFADADVDGDGSVSAQELSESGLVNALSSRGRSLLMSP